MDKQRGFLMIVIAVMLVIIAALASSFVAMTLSGTNSSISAMTANSAYDVAQAGIEAGSYQLVGSTAWCDGSWQSIVVVTGQGEFQYSCTKNTGASTVSSALTVSSNAIPLASVAGFASFGAVTIDSEMIYYEGISGTTLLNARRGQNGTTASTHLINATASQVQYIITSQGGAPSLTASNGKITLSQAVLLSTPSVYFAAGTDGTKSIILQYSDGAWITNEFLSGVTFYGIFINTVSKGIAVGYDGSNQGYIYIYNGISWTWDSRSVINDNLSRVLLQEVSCDSLSNCWAVGHQRAPDRGDMFYYNFTTGVNYISGPSQNFTLYGVSCTSGTCITAGDNVLSPNNITYQLAPNTSVPFNVTTNLKSTATVKGIDCTQAGPCVAVLSDGSVSYYNGSWSASSYSISASSLNGVNCPNNTQCMVVGNNGKNFKCTLPITSAASCVAQTAPSAGTLLGVRCNATNDCMAVGSSTNNSYHFDGSNWTSIPLGGTYTLNAIGGIPGGSGVQITPTVWRNH